MKTVCLKITGILMLFSIMFPYLADLKRSSKKASFISFIYFNKRSLSTTIVAVKMSFEFSQNLLADIGSSQSPKSSLSLSLPTSSSVNPSLVSQFQKSQSFKTQEMTFSQNLLDITGDNSQPSSCFKTHCNTRENQCECC